MQQKKLLVPETHYICELDRSVGGVILPKVLRSLVEMECMMSMNPGECIQVTKTLWRSKQNEEKKGANYLHLSNHVSELSQDYSWNVTQWGKESHRA